MRTKRIPMSTESIRAKLKERLREVNIRMESKAGDEAEKLGLDYMSFGRWGKDGRVTHKSKGDKLVPLSKQASDAATNDEPSDPEQSIGGPNMRVNPAPVKTQAQTYRPSEKAFHINHKDAAQQMPGMIKSLIQRYPHHSIAIEPGPDGIKLIPRAIQQGEPKKFTIDVGPISVDTRDGQVSVGGQPIKVSKTESKLIMYLAGNQNKIATRGDLLEKVWEASPDTATRVVDMTIARLKQRLGSAGNMIDNIRGMGYRLTAPESK